jgi:ATP-binding cassette subfamily B protein
MPKALQRLGVGSLLGWQSVVREVPCETVLASTETVCVCLPTVVFQALLQHEAGFAAAFGIRSD